MHRQAEQTRRPLVGGLCLWIMLVLGVLPVPLVAPVLVSMLEPEYRDVTVFVVVPVLVPQAPVGTRTARNLILFYYVPSLFVP